MVPHAWLIFNEEKDFSVRCFVLIGFATVHLYDASNQNLFLHRFRISWSRKTELEAHDSDQKSVDLETTTPVVETGKALTTEGLRENNLIFGQFSETSNVKVF